MVMIKLTAVQAPRHHNNWLRFGYNLSLRIGDGGNALSDADIITDFTDGSDDFGLTNGLSFGDLTITQGTWRLCQRHHH